MRKFLVMPLLLCSSPALAAEGYYKDLFVNAGVWLSDYTDFPAATDLNLSTEYIKVGDTEADVTKQNRMMAGVGNAYDSNGVLLYPDGSPRFRLMYVNGGRSWKHAPMSGDKLFTAVEAFVKNGGSYSGSCAGALLLGPWAYYIYPRKPYYGRDNATGDSIVNTKLPQYIEPGSGLLNYASFSTKKDGMYYIPDIYYNGGCYEVRSLPTNAEILATYAPYAPAKSTYNTNGKVSTWAYKASATSGRVVATCSHPEKRSVSSDAGKMFKAMLQYAMAGNGTPKVKATLSGSGSWRDMNNNASSGREKIGDKQYHHFKVVVPSGAKSMKIDLEGSAYDFDLYVKYADFAFRGGSGVRASNGPTRLESVTINNPASGTWYVGVSQFKTVGTSKMSHGYEYTSNLEVLNGIAYRVRATITQ